MVDKTWELRNYIPPHTRCTNCGGCCGPVPITVFDFARISNYLQGDAYARKVVQREHEPLECVFRDNEQKECAIYSVRPLICRLFGVEVGLHCPQGNSAKVDMFAFIDFSQEIYGVQNDIRWL